MSLQNIKNFIIKNKKVLLFVSFFALLIFPDFAFAADNNSSSVVDILNYIIKFSAVVLGIVTNFVAWFMSPAWTNGTAVGISGHLKDLWIMMSNVVYFIFAFILIWIALMNIFGKGGDWELKQALPRFVGGVLIVPFSWLIVGAMISLSSILSVSVLTLPQDSFPDVYDQNLKGVEFCTNYDFNVSGNNSGEVPIKCIGGKKDFNEYIKDSNNIFGIINVYTFGIMKMDDQGKLFSDSTVRHGIKSLTDIGVKGILDILFIVVYLILMIALLMALFVRGVYIWLFMVISPLFGLMFFFKDKGGDVFKKFSLSNFVGLALMPVYVSAALAFGLLFILVAGNQMKENCTGGSTPNKLCVDNKDNVSSVTFLGITLNFKGAFSSSSSDVNGTISDLKGAFGLMIMQIFGLAVLRIAVMAALGSTDITKEVVAPIKSFGDSVGKLAAAAPTYAPIIPSPTGGKPMSATELGSASTSFKSSIDSHFTGKGSELGASMSPFAQTNASEMHTTNAKYNKGIINNSNDAEKYIFDIRSKINGDLGKTLKDDSSRRELVKMISTIFGDKLGEKLKNIKDPQKFGDAFLRNKSLITKDNGASDGGVQFNNNILSRKDKDGIIELFGGSASTPESPKTKETKKSEVKIEIKGDKIDGSKIDGNKIPESVNYLKDKFNIKGEGTEDEKIKIITDKMTKIKGTANIKNEEVKEIAKALLKKWKDDESSTS